MKIHELNLVSKTKKKRIGRGIAANQGKTAGRGTKGQKSRSGGNIKPGFEGGQTKLARRLPKLRGFKSINRKDYQVVGLNDLAKIKSIKIDKQVLENNGIIKNKKNPIVVLANGKIDRKITLITDKISKSAYAQIIKKGGEVIIEKEREKVKKSITK